MRFGRRRKDSSCTLYFCNFEIPQNNFSFKSTSPETTWNNCGLWTKLSFTKQHLQRARNARVLNRQPSFKESKFYVPGCSSYIIYKGGCTAQVGMNLKKAIWGNLVKRWKLSFGTKVFESSEGSLIENNMIQPATTQDDTHLVLLHLIWDSKYQFYELWDVNCDFYVVLMLRGS